MTPTLLDVAMAQPGVGCAAAAWRRVGLPQRTPVVIPTAALADVVGCSRRTLRRYLLDAESCGLLTLDGYAPRARELVARTGTMDLGDAAVAAAWTWLLTAQRCTGCRRLKSAQGRVCKRCRVARRRDLAGVVAACADARRARDAGRRVSPVLLASRHKCPLWTTESFSHGRLIPLQGLVRRLEREGLLTDEQIAYWRERERNAVGGASMEGDN